MTSWIGRNAPGACAAIGAPASLARFGRAVEFAVLLGSSSVAHEGHDHDKPPPLNLPIAPRVIAVTPDYELVGVLSGEGRLTIFLHRFATGEPVEERKLHYRGGRHEVEREAAKSPASSSCRTMDQRQEPIDIVFKLTLPEDQDILTGRLEKPTALAASRGRTARPTQFDNSCTPRPARSWPACC